MSVKASTWAWAQRVAPATKAVLLALADHADDDGTCWPGRKGLAQKLGIDDRNVTRHLAKLERTGLIRAEARFRPDGSRTTNLYYLLGVIELSVPLDENVYTPSAKTSIPLDEFVQTGTIIEPPKEEKETLSSRVQRKPLPVTPDFIELLVAEFAPRLGGNGRCRETIEEALNHKAMDKRKDKRLYLRTWLRRETEGYQRRQPNATSSAYSPGSIIASGRPSPHKIVYTPKPDADGIYRLGK